MEVLRDPDFVIQSFTHFQAAKRSTSDFSLQQLGSPLSPKRFTHKEWQALDDFCCSL
jgi:hypothetical protein